ncbi:hypothetical protein ACIQC5_08010 [Paenarthrobacter sp. NPDC092416]|uniref:hypothetical protein n=1 Tax=Paenarthrobacter sp. NPDC092416 TaxID=3364386 RepID=UPI003802145F
MAGASEDPSGSRPEFEVIGGGVIDDRPSERRSRQGADLPGFDLDGSSKPRTREVLRHAGRAAWQEARESFASVWFWLACAVGLGLSFGAAAGMVAYGEANGWFESAIPEASYLLTTFWLSLASAILGAVWGFRLKPPSLAVFPAFLAGLLRGCAFGIPAGIVLLILGSNVGGPVELVAPAVVVMVGEAALFGLIGAGSRACFAKAAPGAVLTTVLLAILCMGNVVTTVFLIPRMEVIDQVSVPINVQRDKSGRVTSFECVGAFRSESVVHTERVAWLTASNPAVLLGSFAANVVPPENDVAWVLIGFQAAADGPYWDTPCIGGVESDAISPAPPLWITGLAGQLVVVALVVVPGRWLAARRISPAS